MTGHELAYQLMWSMATAGVVEAEGINAMAQAILQIGSRSQDDRIRPGAVLLLREVADQLEAQDQCERARAEGRIQ